MNRNIEVFSYQIKKERRRRTFSFILFCICLYVFINIVISYLIYPLRQNALSMIPDIPEKSVVLVSPVAGKYQRGDVVLLKPRNMIQLIADKLFEHSEKRKIIYS